jgi:hypothetical protein
MWKYNGEKLLNVIILSLESLAIAVMWRRPSGPR